MAGCGRIASSGTGHTFDEHLTSPTVDHAKKTQKGDSVLNLALNMGFFGRLFFGEKQPQEAPPERVKESVATLEGYARGIMSHYGETHFTGDTQAKLILSVYSFGGVSALAMQYQMSQAQAHAVCMTLFMQVFEFTPEDTATKAQTLVAAASDRTSHLYPTIYRGMNGFLHWHKHADDGAARDFAEIMAHFQKSKS